MSPESGGAMSAAQDRQRWEVILSVAPEGGVRTSMEEMLAEIRRLDAEVERLDQRAAQAEEVAHKRAMAVGEARRGWDEARATARQLLAVVRLVQRDELRGQAMSRDVRDALDDLPAALQRAICRGEELPGGV